MKTAETGGTMAKRSYSLAKVYGLLEPGPVVLVTTALKGRPNIMTMSWHTMMEFEPPLVGCVKKHPKTIHHRGKGAFMIAGETIKLPSKMK